MDATFFFRLYGSVSLYLEGQLGSAGFVAAFYDLLDEIPSNQPRCFIALIESFNEELGCYQPDQGIREGQSGLYGEVDLRNKKNDF